MFAVPGRLPAIHAVAIIALLATSAHAQQRIPLTLAEAEDLALRDEPGQASLLAQAAALDEESVAAGQLPDPMLRTAVANYPIESGGFTTEGMSQVQLGLHQVFPPGDTREISMHRVETLALAMKEHADGRGRDVLTAVRQSWLEAYYWQRAQAIVSESRPFFEDLATVTRSMYSVGRKDQLDLLRADLELSRIDDRLIEINRQHARAVAALSEWVGDNAARRLADKLPEWTGLPSIETLRAGLMEHPMLRAADARIEARQAGVNLAEEKYKPGWAVDFGYAHRNGVLPNGEPRSDFVTLAVTMDLPMFRKNRQDRRVAAALNERRAAIDSKEQLLRRLRSRLDAEYARWTDLNRRIDLYDRQILSLASDHAQAALLAYQSDAGDFADVMRGYINDLNTRVDHIRLQVERAQSYATLANLGGLPR